MTLRTKGSAVLCVSGPSPDEPWDLPGHRGASSLLLRPKAAYLSRRTKWILTYWAEVREDGDVKKSRCTKFKVDKTMHWLCLFSIRKIGYFNSFILWSAKKKWIHYCISLNGRLCIILFYQMRIGAKLKYKLKSHSCCLGV